MNLISLLLFVVVITRLDIAFATSRLARYMLNLGLAYHVVANRTLLYLLSTQNLALC
jgi:hypothetical protein